MNEKTKFELLQKLRLAKILFSFVGALVLLLILSGVIYVLVTNEKIPVAAIIVEESKVLKEAKIAFGYQRLLQKKQLQYSFNSHDYQWNFPEKIIKMQFNSRDNQVEAEYFIKDSLIKIWLNKIELKDKRLYQKYSSLAKKYLFYDIFWLNPLLLLELQGEKVKIVVKQIENQERSFLLEVSLEAPPDEISEKTSGEISNEVSNDKTQQASYLVEFNQQWLVESAKLWRADIPLKGVKAQFNLYKNFADNENEKIQFAQERKLWYIELPPAKIATE